VRFAGVIPGRARGRGNLTGEMRMSRLCELWLKEVEVGERVEPQTIDRYRGQVTGRGRRSTFGWRRAPRSASPPSSSRSIEGCNDKWLAKDSDGSRTVTRSDGSSGVVTAQEGQPLHPGRLGKADLAESWAEPSHERSLRFLRLPHLDHDKPRCTDRGSVALQWRRPISFTGLGVDTEYLVDGSILVRGSARELQNEDFGHESFPFQMSPVAWVGLASAVAPITR